MFGGSTGAGIASYAQCHRIFVFFVVHQGRLVVVWCALFFGFTFFEFFQRFHWFGQFHLKFLKVRQDW